ncbi:MAG TPA: recombinase family protein [Symbiobacteriaceae bacterium]|nr:recombinase family protein [Symbiobacteriaceae bacterium]
MISEQASVDPTKVAIYIRWSTEDQGEGTTLEVQSETCRAYLISQGWVVNGELVFIDDGYSGGSIDRPAMGKLRAAVAAGQVHCVVVYKLDRLSRSVVDTVNLVCREWDGKCSIKSAREPIDTTTHAGKMFFYTLVNYAEWERSVIKERTFSGKMRRAQEGRNPGFRPPYGYAAGEGGAFALVPGEAVIVQRIYREYLSGMGLRQIVTRLNKEGIPPREARMWGQSTVQRILANPAYMGRLEYGRRRQVGSSRIKKKAVVAVDSSMIPVIIAREDWEAVQAVKESRPGFGKGQGSGRAAVSSSLLTGLLKCSRCGHGFAGKSLSHPYHYYRCMGVHMKSSAYCDCGGIRQDLLDELVVSTLRKLYGGEEAKDRLIRQATSHFERQLVEARGALKSLASDVERLAAEEQRLKRMLRAGELTVVEYRELKADLEKEGAELRRSEDRLRSSEKQALAGLNGQERLRETLTQVDEWDRLPHNGRKQLLRQFIQEIRAYRAMRSATVECHIVWRWDSERSGEPPVPTEQYVVAEQGR